jgi:signal peptidase II
MHIIIVTILIFLDQVTKYFAQTRLQDSDWIVLIKEFLYLNYVENRGAAFGILQNQQGFFVVVTLIIISLVIFYRMKNKKILPITSFIFDIIIAGAIGNLIDRIRLGYVIDFIDVKFWGIYDFPVFNVADILIVVGTILLSILILMDKYEMS